MMSQMKPWLFEGAVLMFAVFGAEMALGSDLDRLLDTGSCINCTIENADLSGRVLNFDRIENAQFRNVNFKGATLSVDSLQNVTIERTDFSSAVVSVNLVEDALLQDLSWRSASLRFRDVTRTTMRRIDASSASLSFRSLTYSQVEDYTAPSASWNLAKATDTTFERGRMDSSSVNLAGDEVRFTEVSCRSCSLNLAPTGRAPRGNLEFGWSDLTAASLSIDRMMNVGFTGGTILNRAVVNGRVCARTSVDQCL